MTRHGAPRRFAGCPAVELVTPSGARIAARVATTPAARLLGLAGLDPARIEPLLFPRCRSVHGFWMRSELDVCFIAVDASREESGVVLGVVAPLGRRRFASLRRRDLRGAAGEVATLELAPGSAAELAIGPGSELAVRRISPP